MTIVSLGDNSASGSERAENMRQRRQKANVKAFYRSFLYTIGPHIPPLRPMKWPWDCLYEGKGARAFIVQQPSLIGWWVSQETLIFFPTLPTMVVAALESRPKNILLLSTFHKWEIWHSFNLNDLLRSQEWQARVRNSGSYSAFCSILVLRSSHGYLKQYLSSKPLHILNKNYLPNIRWGDT